MGCVVVFWHRFGDRMFEHSHIRDWSKMCSKMGCVVVFWHRFWDRMFEHLHIMDWSKRCSKMGCVVMFLHRFLDRMFEHSHIMDWSKMCFKKGDRAGLGSRRNGFWSIRIKWMVSERGGEVVFFCGLEVDWNRF